MKGVGAGNDVTLCGLLVFVDEASVKYVPRSRMRNLVDWAWSPKSIR